MLTNAHAEFMDLINRIFKPTLDQYIIIFIIAILMYSKDPQEHVIHLIQVLDTLWQHRLYVKLSKCSFWLNQISFLSYMVYGDGVSVDRSKVEAIINWS